MPFKVPPNSMSQMSVVIDQKSSIYIAQFVFGPKFRKQMDGEDRWRRLRKEDGRIGRDLWLQGFENKELEGCCETDVTIWKKNFTNNGIVNITLPERDLDQLGSEFVGLIFVKGNNFKI